MPITTLAPTVDSSALVLSPETAAKLGKLIEDGTARNTIRARSGDLARFWEALATLRPDVPKSYPVPLAAVLEFIAHGLDVWTAATVERTVRTLSRAHHAAGVANEVNPTRQAPVREALRAAKTLRARKGGQRQARAVRLGDVRRMVATCEAEDGLTAARDSALLWTLYASGLRRSEVCRLDVTDLANEITEDGGLLFVLTVRRSKADQTGEGRAVAIGGEAAETLAAWLQESGITSGRVFRGFFKGGRSLRPSLSPDGVARILAHRAKLAGVEPVSPHGFRAGFATDCAARGIAPADIMAGRWTSLASFGRYTRAAVASRNPAAFLTVENS